VFDICSRTQRARVGGREELFQARKRRRHPMKSRKVRDLMVPLDEYATVSEDSSLHEAVLALEEAQERFRKERYKHRAILVYDKNKRVVGKLSQLDVIKGLEAGYKRLELKGISHTGFSPEFIKSLIKTHDLWSKPLDEICRKAADIKVKEVMYTPTEGEYVREDATLDEAIHQLVMGKHQSLLVTSQKKIVGILRLTDVFMEVCELVKACQV
jgi:CBS domain-containing protein